MGGPAESDGHMVGLGETQAKRGGYDIPIPRDKAASFVT